LPTVKESVVVCAWRNECGNTQCPHYFSHAEIDNCREDNECDEILRTVFCRPNIFEEDGDVNEEAKTILKEARVVASMMV